MTHSLFPRYLKTPIYISMLVTTMMILGILILFFNLQPQVPLFYSLALPSQHLVSKEWLFLLPSISLVINLIHLMIVRTARHQDKILMKLFAWTSAGMQIALGLALFRILVIIT